jgi:hypothetical protein
MGAIVCFLAVHITLAILVPKSLGRAYDTRSAGDGEVATMPMHSFGVFGPEAIAEISEALDAAFEKLQETGEPEVVREIIAGGIIAAAIGERDPASLLAAALRRPE